MTCHNVLDWLAADSDGECPPDVIDHLSDCSSCVAALEARFRADFALYLGQVMESARQAYDGTSRAG